MNKTISGVETCSERNTVRQTPQPGGWGEIPGIPEGPQQAATGRARTEAGSRVN